MTQRIGRAWFAPFGAAALAFAVASLVATPYAVGIFHDDGVYVILAKSIATGAGYRYLHLPGLPAAAHYPPGYPLLLAALWRFAPGFPGNTSIFLLVNALFLAGIAWGTAWFARRVLAWNWLAASIAGVIATISLPLMMLSRLVLSEPMFVALLLPTLVAAEGVVRTQGEGPRWWRAFGVGLAIGALMLVRTHAAALALAFVSILAVRRRWSEVWQAVAGVAAVLAPWEAWQLLHPAGLPELLRGSYGSYTAWLADGFHGGARFVARTILDNVHEVGALLADRFALGDRVGPREAATLLAAAAALGGAARALRRAPVTVAFVALYVAVVLVWPFTPWRFVFALWPFVILALGEAVGWALAGARARRLVPALALAMLTILAAGSLRSEVRAYSGHLLRGSAAPATAQVAPLVQWIAAKTKPTDVVAADIEPLVYLYTGRQSVPLAPFTAAEYLTPRSVAQNAASLRRLLNDVPVTLVATVSSNLYASAKQLAPSTSSHASASLVQIDSLPGGGAFRVERP